MEKKYTGFQDLPKEVTERLEKRIAEAIPRPKIPEGTSTEEAIRLIKLHVQDRDYSERELEEIVDAFNIFNNAVLKGLPNQLYQIMVRVLDSEIAKRAYAAYAIWYAHEGIELAKKEVQSFADRIKAEINKRAEWTEDQFHDEYFLRPK
jgi:hypothetical protein